MGLIYGVCFLITAVAAVETGNQALKTEKVEDRVAEWAKCFFYSACLFQLLAGGAFTGFVGCIIHSLVLEKENEKFYFANVVVTLSKIDLHDIPLMVMGFFQTRKEGPSPDVPDLSN